MTPEKNEMLIKVTKTFSLESLQRPVDLYKLATDFGISSVEVDAISSEAMLAPIANGYKITLKKTTSNSGLTRQRFSFAHELGHLLLKDIGYKSGSDSSAKHRANSINNEEERLCDQIAAEILMPRTAFIADTDRMGWSLHSVRGLSNLYEASIPATASRMVNLMAESCAIGIWKPAPNSVEPHKLQQSLGPQIRYRIPNSARLPRRRSWLIARAANSQIVEPGILPLLDKSRPLAFPPDVPAEAWAWGKDEFRRVMVFYYPERELTSDMLAVANATWRAF